MAFVAHANFRQLPVLREMAQPVHINAQGSIADDVDPAMWARNHILAILMTMTGERVMRPTYGVGVQKLLFENDTTMIQQQILAAIQAQLATYEPNLNVTDLQFLYEPDMSGIVTLQVAYWVGSNSSMRTIAITLDGTKIERRV
jgi:phage baseplate assembly protein W